MSIPNSFKTNEPESLRSLKGSHALSLMTRIALLTFLNHVPSGLAVHDFRLVSLNSFILPGESGSVAKLEHRRIRFRLFRVHDD